MTTNAQVFDLDNAISTLTLTKNLTKSTDGGTFECKTDTGNHESRISVHLFTGKILRMFRFIRKHTYVIQPKNSAVKNSNFHLEKKKPKTLRIHVHVRTGT